MICGEKKMLLASRIWVSLIGLLSIISAMPHWFRVEGLAAQRGVHALGLIGRANVRADMRGMFLAIGMFALIASYRKSKTWLLATILLPAFAILGRFVSIGIDGYEPRVLQPILIELAVIALLSLAYQVWKKVPEGL
jgi:hypothetical protein